MASQTQASALSRIRMILWGLVIVAGIAATAIFVFFPPGNPVGLTGASFRVQSTDGRVFTERTLTGSPALYFFGFTYCPDVCPTTLAETVAWRDALGLAPGQLQIFFVTVDPERDTLDNLRTYLAAFDPRIIGLRGANETQTEAIKRAFGVFSQKVDDPSSSEYLVDHTATVFMIDADGSFEGTIAFGEKRDVVIAKIRRLVGI